MPHPASALIGALLLGATAAHAGPGEAVACHLSYGGETKSIEARPVTSPYSVPPIEIGSYLLFRAVFRREPADLASIKLYAHAHHDDWRPIIQQATYAYPPTPQSSHGFTGLQRIYEPRHGGELEYWCEWRKTISK